MRRHHILLAVFLIALAGVVAGWSAYVKAGDFILAAMIDEARHDAVAFEFTNDPLKGSRADLNSFAYRNVKARLHRLRQVDPRIRFVYIFRHIPATNKVIFLADSDDPGSPDESLPGDEYREAAQSPGLQEIIRTGQPTTEGPLRDSFGTWITAYTLVGPPANSGSGRDILGLDLSATSWRRYRLLAATSAAVAVWLFLGVPFAGLLAVRRQYEQREAIRNLSEAMEQSHSAVMIVDLNGRIEYANRSLCRQTGYARRDLIGHDWRDFQLHDAPPELLADLMTSVRSGHTWTGEWLYERKDDTAYPIRCVVSPVLRRDGSLSCYVLILEDMTEVKRTESTLRDAKEEAEAGNRAKGKFLATMSHEVRTPLNGIVGFTSLLLETSLTAEQREYIQTIRTSSEALIQLTGDILDFARIESGKLKLDLQPCDPRECVEDALDLLAARAADKRLELLHWIESDVPTSVLADGGRLRQVLVNLVTNAVKFTPAGEVSVTMSVDYPFAALGSGDCQLTVKVRDTGIGIAEAQHGNLFKPFSQIDDSTTRRYSGTGLGLAICKNLVEMMGGHIHVASTPGGGSTFTFGIRATPIAPAPVFNAPMGGRTLVVAGHEESFRTELANLGKRFGATVVETTPDKLAALGNWDVALVDVDEAFANDLVHSPAKPGLPANKMIGLVSLALRSELRTGLRAHFRSLMHKPARHGALWEALAAPMATALAADPAKMEAVNLRVLLVEDNAVNQRLMQKMLGHLSCQWTLAENGRLAIEELSKQPYDVVLMDLHMPEMDGVTATEHIRAAKAGGEMRAVWIIALTADARDEQRERALSAGANDYLTKPIRLSDLTIALQKFVRARRA